MTGLYVATVDNQPVRASFGQERGRQEREREEQDEARVHRGRVAGLERDRVREAGERQAPQGAVEQEDDHADHPGLRSSHRATSRACSTGMAA